MFLETSILKQQPCCEILQRLYKAGGIVELGNIWSEMGKPKWVCSSYPPLANRSLFFHDFCFFLNCSFLCEQELVLNLAFISGLISQIIARLDDWARLVLERLWQVKFSLLNVSNCDHNVAASLQANQPFRTHWYDKAQIKLHSVLWYDACSKNFQIKLKQRWGRARC